MKFDQNSTKVSESKPNWGAIYAMSLCVFVLIASEFMPVSLLSPIAHDLHLTSGEAGQAISISGLFAFLASLLISRFIGQLDRRLVVLALTALLIVSGICVALATNYIFMMMGRALLGIAIGGFWSISAAITMRLVPPASVPKAFAVTNGGNALASIIAAPLGSFMGGLIGWRGAFFCVVPLALIALLWQAFAIPALPSEHKQKKGRLLALLKRPFVLIGLIGQMVIFGGMFSVFIYLRPFLEQVTHVNLETLSSLLLLVGISGFIGTVLIGRVIDNRVHILIAVLALILAVIAVCLALLGNSLIVTAILLTIWGFTFTALPVAGWTWIARAASDDPEAGGALIVAGIQLSIMLGATLGGLVYDHFGAKTEFIGGSVILIIGALLAFISKIPTTQNSK